ncbi:ABC transporter ATP-binding protein [Dehalobacterium formicoaceticum]|uniref:ABC transporter ATP-binding protein n=1 Tax=Dehalobacterium formicoaceticum TaxID=51515 RepID=UPI000B7E37BB|nr:ABC transporter ATP-binding protein [Dehalobacterium formicoaceticum]
MGGELSESNEIMIDVRDLVKKFYIGTPNELLILKNIYLTVKKGEFISIVGASGSGKSTLMNIIGALDRPTSGEYFLDGVPIQDMSNNELSDIRNKKIGFVFQTFNLIPRNSALKNVELPMLYAGVGRKERRERAEELLELVGMNDRMDHLPNELSGGQKQRVAISRALANDPAILLADEPTGALDSETGRKVMELFHEVHEAKGTTIILITHNQELAMETQRIVTIKDGRIIEAEAEAEAEANRKLTADHG